MTNLKNNYKKFYNVTDIRSSQVIGIENKIENILTDNFINKALQSKGSEISNIVNNKNTNSLLNTDSSVKITSTNITTLSKFLLFNNKSNTNLQQSSNTTVKNTIKNFSIGNKAMNLNTFKTLINNFNVDVKKIEKELTNKNNLRYYLNMLTNFEFNPTNNSYNLYRFNKTNSYVFAMKKATKFLNLAFNTKGCFISKPSFNLISASNKIENEIISNASQNFNSTKVIINLFYYIKTNELSSKNVIFENNNATILSELFGQKFSYLTDYLTKLFNAEIELNLVRLYKPYQDSNILVQFLNSESYNNKFIRLVSRLFKNINISNSKKAEIFSEYNLLAIGKKDYISYPSNISGVNVKLAGRPLNERIIPRLTVKRAQRGSFNRLNAKMIEKSIYTDKTRKGAYSFTVTLSQNFN